MANVNLRRAPQGSVGSLEPFCTRPIALILIILIVLSLSLQSTFIRSIAGLTNLGQPSGQQGE